MEQYTEETHQSLIEWLTEYHKEFIQKCNDKPVDLFSIEAVAFLDRYVEDVSVKYQSQYYEGFDAFQNAIGYYVGMMIAQKHKGKWFSSTDKDGDKEIWLGIGDKIKMFPHMKVLKRYLNGPEDSLVTFVKSVDQIQSHL